MTVRYIAAGTLALLFAISAPIAFSANGQASSEQAPDGMNMMGMGMGMGAQPMKSEAVAARGVVNSIDTARHTINISHQAIKSIGWPAMTMGFRVADPKVLEGVQVGSTVDFWFEDNGPGNYLITKIRPPAK